MNRHLPARFLPGARSAQASWPGRGTAIAASGSLLPASFLLAAVILLLAACGSSSALPQLRITNNGTVPIQGLVVLFPEDRVEFGDVGPGQTTEYRDVPHGVYNYAACEYMLNGQKVTQPVIDWVGESPRPGQAFTYMLDFDPSRTDMLAVQLVQATVDR